MPLTNLNPQRHCSHTTDILTYSNTTVAIPDMSHLSMLLLINWQFITVATWLSVMLGKLYLMYSSVLCLIDWRPAAIICKVDYVLIMPIDEVGTEK